MFFFCKKKKNKNAKFHCTTPQSGSVFYCMICVNKWMKWICIIYFILHKEMRAKSEGIVGLASIQGPERWWTMPAEDEARGNSGGGSQRYWRANRSSHVGIGAKDQSNHLVAGSLRSFPQDSWSLFKQMCSNLNFFFCFSRIYFSENKKKETFFWRKTIYNCLTKENCPLFFQTFKKTKAHLTFIH